MHLKIFSIKSDCTSGTIEGLRTLAIIVVYKINVDPPNLENMVLWAV